MSSPTPSRDDIIASVRAFLLEDALAGEAPTALTGTTRLMSGGVLDSIGSVKLVAHLEKSFGIRFAAHEISVDYLDTVDLIADVVGRKLAK